MPPERLWSKLLLRGPPECGLVAQSRIINFVPISMSIPHDPFVTAGMTFMGNSAPLNPLDLL